MPKEQKKCDSVLATCHHFLERGLQFCFGLRSCLRNSRCVLVQTEMTCSETQLINDASAEYEYPFNCELPCFLLSEECSRKVTDGMEI